MPVVGNDMLSIDISGSWQTLMLMRNAFSPAKFNNAMHGIFKRAAGHAKVVLKADIPKEYYAEKRDIAATIQSPQVLANAAGIGCTIPVKGQRRAIGGNHIKAYGGHYGWRPPSYTVSADIVKTARSVLPSKLSGKGNNAPFRNIDPRNGNRVANRIGGVAFTRNTQQRFPIEKLSAIAIPQMVTNRASTDIDNDMGTYLQGRIAARWRAYLTTGK